MKKRKNPPSSKAIVLLSGGLDSATTLYLAKEKGYKTHCLIFDYAQRHRKEIRQAIKIAKKSRSPYSVVKIPLLLSSANSDGISSALLDRKVDIPIHRNIDQSIPATYVPARNIIFLSFAASLAEGVGAKAIFIGANAVDFSGYPDCRPKFYMAYQKVLREGLKTGAEGKMIRIFTPLIRKTKSQIIRLGLKLGVPYELTWSCYQGARKPCGNCDSCVLRAKGFYEAGCHDPALA